MNSKKIILAATLCSGLLSLPVISSASVVPYQPAIDSAITVPEVVKVVNPEGLYRRHEGAVVTLSFTLDEKGQPHDIKIVSGADRNLKESVLTAVAQWKFSPALKNGEPFATKVIMPIELTADPVS